MSEYALELRESDRIRSVQTPVIPFVADLIRRNPGTISLGQGVVHYPPPAEAFRHLAQSVSSGTTHQYGHVSGIPELLDGLRTKLLSENGIRPERIVVTAGGNMAFVNAVLAVADPGDEIILLAPYYFNHEMAVRMASAVPIVVPTDSAYRLDPDAVAAAVTSRTRAVVTISPNNPTGTVYDRDSLVEVNRMCAERGIYHISDEAYEYFTFGGLRHCSPASLQGSERHTISLFSFSKAYGMAGLRVGYMVIPEHLYEPVRKIQDTILICPPVASQYAAVGALEAGPAYCRPYIEELSAIRNLVRTNLESVGDLVDIPPMDGAFYALIRLHTHLDDVTVVRSLIERHRVAVIPGSTFGTPEGCYLRIAYAALRKEIIEEALARLVRGLEDVRA